MTSFNEWETARQKAETTRPTKVTDLDLMERAWQAGRDSVLPALKEHQDMLKAAYDALRRVTASLNAFAGKIAEFAESAEAHPEEVPDH